MTNPMSIAERLEEVANDLQFAATAIIDLYVVVPRAETKLRTIATDLRAQVPVGVEKHIKRLRLHGNPQNWEAANIIEAQAREIAGLKGNNDDLRVDLRDYHPSNEAALLARAAALGAENAALRNALEKIAERFNWAEHPASIEWRTHQEAVNALTPKQECPSCGSGMLLSRCSDCPRITSPDKAIRRIAAMIAKMPRS